MNSLFEIAESRKGEPVNENREIILEKRNNSSIFINFKGNFDKLNGYYGTTIKEGATMVISADDLRPVIAEWDKGLGRVTVFMSDLASNWSAALFDDEDGQKCRCIVENLLINSLNPKGTQSTGLEIKSERVEDKTRLTVETPRRISNGEKLVVKVKDASGNVVAYDDFDRIADAKYRIDLDTSDVAGTYIMEVRLQSTSEERPSLFDKTDYAVVGFYAKEYDLFGVDGASIITDLANAGGGDMINSADEFFDVQKPEFKQYDHSNRIAIPALVVALVLFILDIFFRNFLKRREKKKKIMTDEEQFASMRGR